MPNPDLQKSLKEILSENLKSIQDRIHAACQRSDRDPKDIRLVWVSKNHPRETILEALNLGAYFFGENRVQEAMEKFPLGDGGTENSLAGLSTNPSENSSTNPSRQNYELHLIGRLQKNKVRKILSLVTAIHSIDSVDLLETVNRVCGELGLKRDVFLQVNTSRELAKGGFEPEAIAEIFPHLPTLSHLRIVGLMTMGPVDGPAAEPSSGKISLLPTSLPSIEHRTARDCFLELADLQKKYQSQTGPLKDLAWLSMGMTGDFEEAIECGAHFIRVGTGLFGTR